MFAFHITDATRAHLERIEQLREQLDRRGPLPRVWAGRTRADLAAEAASASVRLEGSSVTADEARRILMGDRPTSVSAPDAAEVVAYRDAMSLVLSRADDAGFAWQRELLLAVHRSVLGASFAAEAGRIRRIQNWLADTATGEQVYLPPAPDVVPGLLDDLCDWLATSREAAPVTAALAHVRLGAVHPFRDGNGRTARVIASLAMFRGGFRAPQFTSLEEWWGRNPAVYYGAFRCLGETFDESADVTPFVSAHVAAQAAQAEALSLRDGLERALWTVLSDIVVYDLKLHERTAHAVYDALFGRVVTNRYYRSVADLSDVTAVNDLRKLVAAGVIESRGGGRTAHYVGTDRLLDRVAEVAGIDVARLGAGDFCERARALVAALAHRLQGDEVREDSLPYCASVARPSRP